MHFATPLRAAAFAALSAAALAAAAPPPRPIAASGLAQAPIVPDPPSIRPIDRWLGETRAVALDGDRAYFSVGRAIAVADITDPAAPRLIGRSAPLALPDGDAFARPIDDIAVSDGTAWTLTPDTSPVISAWDVSDASAPRSVATMPLADHQGPIGLDARGGVALVSYEGVWPDRGILALRRRAEGIATVGRWQLDHPFAFVGDVAWRTGSEALVSLGGEGLARLSITVAPDGEVDFSVIGAATEVRFAEGARHLAIDGCRAYSSDADGWAWTRGGFWVFDVCGDGAPSLLAAHSFSSEGRFNPAGLTARTVAGLNLVLMSDSGGGLRAIDATEPTDTEWPETEIYPTITGEPVCHSELAMAADKLVVAGCGLRVLQMAPDAVQPVLDGAILSAPSYGDGSTDGAPLTAMALADDAVLIAHGNVLSLVDPNTPTAPSVTGHVGYVFTGIPIQDVSDLAVAGHTAFVVPRDEPPIPIDISDPQSPRVIEGTYSPAQVIAATDHRIATSMDGLVELFDVADPRLPRSLSTLRLEVPPFGDMVFIGERLIASAGDEGLIVVDVQDPVRPTVIGRRTDTAIGAMAAAAGMAVALTESGGGEPSLAIFNIDAIDDGQIRLESTVALPAADSSASDTAVGLGQAGGRRLAVVQRGATLVAVDITDPSRPVVGPAFALPHDTNAMAVKGDRAFLFGPRVGTEFSVFELVAPQGLVRLMLPILSNVATLRD